MDIIENNYKITVKNSVTQHAFDYLINKRKPFKSKN